MPFAALLYRRKRRPAFLAACLGIFILLVLYRHRRWYSQFSPSSINHTSSPAIDSFLEDRAQFWESIHRIILNNRPQCRKPPEIVIPKKLDILYEDDHVHDRPDILWLERSDLEQLKTAHQRFVDDVQSAQTRLVYRKGTQGIVTTVSDSRIPILLIQLRMLRLTGSRLPVEVFFSQPTPYTDHICTKILSSFDVTCIYLSKIFSTSGKNVDISSYQYKIFAILFSSFDEVLLLDSDAWPVSSPDHLFHHPPFTDTGLVLWPDFWYASESPYYFSIAEIESPPTLQDKPATESGELMYAKSRHETSILLAAYYNYYGPEYYYPLQSQGAPGQGDKETFGCAALALREQYYTVKTMVTAVGRLDSSGHFLGTAMVQYDPVVDLQQNSRTSISLASSSTIVEDQGGMRFDSQKEELRPKQAKFPKQINKPMFIHANTPKFDPRNIFDDHDIGEIRTSPARDTNGTYVRCWDLNPETASQRFGYDVEERFWKTIRTVACEDLLDGFKTNAIQNSNEFLTCEKVKQYVRHVFGEDDDKNDGHSN